MITRTTRFELEFGNEMLSLHAAAPVDLITLPEAAPLPDPGRAIRDSLCHPLAGPSLIEMAWLTVRRKADAEAVIVVSDNTRPVPYRGADGVLEPIMEALREGGIARITVLVATGTHRPMSDAELRRILPAACFEGGVVIRNHDCRDRDGLRRLGRTARGTEVWINRHYLDADLKILTGLVEPHFMAGVSGGAKSICPGLVGEAVTYGFHSAAMMADPRSRSLNVRDNPCYDEARSVAAMAGSGFVVNVTINRSKRLTGVFTGSLEAAHQAAAARVLAEAGVPLAHEYDAVVTHAGFAGINHYQAAKAAVEGARAVRRGGKLILTANHTDVDPVGGPQYRRLLPLLRQLGPDAFDAKVLAPDWEFVPEQWEVQMWARVVRRLGPDGRLVYCAPQLTGDAFVERGLPGTDGGAKLTGLQGRDLAQAMVQHAIDGLPPGCSTAVLAEGPYAVPTLGS